MGWTEKETQILKEKYPYIPNREIKKLLPEKTYDAIKSKAIRLGIEKKINVQTSNFTRGNELPLKQGNKHNIDLSIYEGKKIKHAYISDTHLGSKYQQLSFLKSFYAYAKSQGCQFAIHSGDLSEGDGHHYHGQRYEMFLNGGKEQSDYIIKNYPSDLKTYLIAGGHDLDWYKNEGFDLLESICEKRDDLVYLGQYDAYLNIGNIKYYIVHPSGGTAYAISYNVQKFAESFSSEEKPDIILCGHYHRAEFIPFYVPKNNDYKL